MLADNGIYKIPGDNSSIYVDPRLWEAIQYTDLGGVIANMLTVAEEPSLYYSAAYAIRDNELDNVSTMITFENRKWPCYISCWNSPTNGFGQWQAGNTSD